MARILLIDDDAALREVLTFTLREQGHEVEAFPDGEKGLAGMEAFQPEVVITDLKMPGIGGMEVLRRSIELEPSTPVILLTAFGSIPEAVEAMRQGAYHYLAKPYDRDELKITVEQALERRRLLLENRTLRARLREESRRLQVIHASEAMSRILEVVRRIGPTNATVLITGESGTGKEVVARALHDASERWEKPFVPVHCAAIPRELIESELFGHVRGAFTGAIRDRPGKLQRADGGTLFLDEVADIPLDLQTKLLRVIESREVDVVGAARPIQVDVRIIAATNADLAGRIREGLFRHDLYYRLNVIPIHIPPLRDRPEDVPALWEHFLRQAAGGAPVRSSPDLIHALLRQPWPGNVRELANVCQRMVLLRKSDLLTERDLVRSTADAGAAGDAAQPRPEGQAGLLGELPPHKLPLLDLEREIIVRALAKHGGNQTRTAEYLCIPRHVLLYRLEKFGIA